VTVNILSMLVRLQGTLGRKDLVKQMVLLPQAKSELAPEKSSSEINLVVGYSNSPRSQTALDLTLWIAHQTRLATGKQVTVQVVYVVENGLPKIPVFDAAKTLRRSVEAEEGGAGRTATLQEVQTSPLGMTDVFETADRILWQARCLAEEWRGSLKTHLRFGSVTEEIQAVVESESAALLILGCEGKDHPLVQKFGEGLICPVLGIPSLLEESN
jgi:nucleotide-binding universal stress UspA family protein